MSEALVYEDFSQEEDILNVENFVWMGQIKTLGKEKQIIMKNLYILGKEIEGVLALSQDQIYELVGEFNYETRDVSIGGMNLKNEKTVIIRGVLEGFNLKGEIIFNPPSIPPSVINLKFQGETVAMNLILDYEKMELEANIKMTLNFIYGIALKEDKHIFINGYRENNYYVIELITEEKSFKMNQ